MKVKTESQSVHTRDYVWHSLPACTSSLGRAQGPSHSLMNSGQLMEYGGERDSHCPQLCARWFAQQAPVDRPEPMATHSLVIAESQNEIERHGWEKGTCREEG